MLDKILAVDRPNHNVWLASNSEANLQCGIIEIRSGKHRPATPSVYDMFCNTRTANTRLGYYKQHTLYALPRNKECCQNKLYNYLPTLNECLLDTQTHTYPRVKNQDSLTHTFYTLMKLWSQTVQMGIQIYNIHHKNLKSLYSKCRHRI